MNTKLDIALWFRHATLPCIFRHAFWYPLSAWTDLTLPCNSGMPLYSVFLGMPSGIFSLPGLRNPRQTAMEQCTAAASLFLYGKELFVACYPLYVAPGKHMEHCACLFVRLSLLLLAPHVFRRKLALSKACKVPLRHLVFGSFFLLSIHNSVPLIGSSCGVVFKLLTCRARGPGFNSRSHRYNFRDWLSPTSNSRYGWKITKVM